MILQPKAGIKSVITSRQYKDTVCLFVYLFIYLFKDSLDFTDN